MAGMKEKIQEETKSGILSRKVRSRKDRMDAMERGEKPAKKEKGKASKARQSYSNGGLVCRANRSK